MTTKHLKDAEAIWGRPIINRPAKEKAAAEVARRLKNDDIVGVGSGSTSFLSLLALVQRRDKEKTAFCAIPASIEMELICAALGVPTTSLHVASPIWCFDGADEIDPVGNMIKGRGGAMLREKMVMQASAEIFMVIDSSKQVAQLGKKFPVPVEIHPEAIRIVKSSLERLDYVTEVSLRQAFGKDGPVITEHGGLILDVRFSQISTDTENRLKSLVGVVETGLFMGYMPHVIMSD